MNDQLPEILLFAVVAAVLVYRLWSVLGRRVDDQAPPIQRVRPGEPALLRPPPPIPAPAPPVQTVEAGLSAIRAADPRFRVEEFLAGARQAFEMIVRAFAEGDTASLRGLLADDVYEVFAAAVHDRLTRREVVTSRIVSVEPPELILARMDGRTAVIGLKIVSSQIAATRDANDRLIDGDPETPAEHIDFWTFARNTRAADPNWILIGTGAPA